MCARMHPPHTHTKSQTSSSSKAFSHHGWVQLPPSSKLVRNRSSWQGSVHKTFLVQVKTSPNKKSKARSTKYERRSRNWTHCSSKDSLLWAGLNGNTGMAPHNRQDCLLVSNLADQHCIYLFSTLHILGSGGGVGAISSASLTAKSYSHFPPASSRLGLSLPLVWSSGLKCPNWLGNPNSLYLHALFLQDARTCLIFILLFRTHVWRDMRQVHDRTIF